MLHPLRRDDEDEGAHRPEPVRQHRDAGALRDALGLDLVGPITILAEAFGERAGAAQLCHLKRISRAPGGGEEVDVVALKGCGDGRKG